MKKNFYFTALLLASGSLFAERVHKKLYTLDIPEQEFQTVSLIKGKGVQLPMQTYPEPGKRHAFRLVPAEGNLVGKHIDIVFINESPSEELINELAETDEKDIVDTKRKGKKQFLRQRLRKRKEAKRGAQALYVRTGNNKKYKLTQYRVPGEKASGKEDNEAVIVATPKGNLQFFEDSEKEPGKKDVFEVLIDN